MAQGDGRALLAVLFGEAQPAQLRQRYAGRHPVTVRGHQPGQAVAGAHLGAGGHVAGQDLGVEGRADTGTLEIQFGATQGRLSVTVCV